MSDFDVENEKRRPGAGDRTLMGVGPSLPETILRRLELNCVPVVFITSMRTIENSHNPSLKERSSRLSVII